MENYNFDSFLLPRYKIVVNISNKDYYYPKSFETEEEARFYCEQKNKKSHTVHFRYLSPNQELLTLHHAKFWVDDEESDFLKKE